MNGTIFEIVKKKQTMKTSILFSLVAVLLSCGTKKSLTTETSTKQTENINPMITATIGEINVPSDHVSISDIRVQENKLLIDVNYSGGCEEHIFQIVGSPMIAKSLPPIRAVQLVHNANGDKCKMMVMKTLEVDIKALAYQQEPGSTIFLTLDGWKERIEYTFE